MSANEYLFCFEFVFQGVENFENAQESTQDSSIPISAKSPAEREGLSQGDDSIDSGMSNLKISPEGQSPESPVFG